MRLFGNASSALLTFILAPDSLKGALCANDACLAMQRGVQRALSSTHNDQFTTIPIPLADGGEGTVEAFARGAGGSIRQATVRGPLGDSVQARWLLLPDGRAVIEMAQASGLTLVPEEKRRATLASSYGTGELIRAALDEGCREILVGIGGSATTDGGTGALQALGVRFLDENATLLPPGGAALQQLSAIDDSALDSRLAQTTIRVLCDVTNSLYGESGAARIYGPQKGASPDEVQLLDAALRHYAHVASTHIGRDISQTPGAGAAGGMGFGLMAFCSAQLVPGIDVVLETADFAKKLETADLVLTAEGAIDEQTPQGKALAGIARAACVASSGRGVPVVAFGGAIKLRGEELRQMGIIAALPLADAPMALEYSMANAAQLLEDAVERAVSLWLCGRVSI
ncbi:MAG TPA: glycerate kinase [Abditibacteriaceae bacterium]